VSGVSPSVVLLAKPANPDAVSLVAAAARLCRKPDSIKRLVEEPIPREQELRLFDAVMDAGHWSCLRHAVFVFGVEGVSRSYTHQHVRHGVGTAYEQQSQHFICEAEGDELEHVALSPQHMRVLDKRFEPTPIALIEGAPPSDALITSFPESDGDKARIIYEGTVRTAKQAYDDLVRLGLAHHEARQVLPNGAATRLIWTANLEAVLNFVGKRACRVNTAEIYKVATLVRDIVKAEVPPLERWLGPTCYTRGICYEGPRRFVKECGKPWGGKSVLWDRDFPKAITFITPKGWWADNHGAPQGSEHDQLPHSQLVQVGGKR
jgi:thymidylate synthase (FAD)